MFLLTPPTGHVQNFGLDKDKGRISKDSSILPLANKKPADKLISYPKQALRTKNPN